MNYADLNQRLEAWVLGDLEDEDLTKDEVLELQERVQAVIAIKINANVGSCTLPAHRTLQ
jgi:nicotinate-nucleotide pyrophosphorylase